MPILSHATIQFPLSWPAFHLDKVLTTRARYSSLPLDHTPLVHAHPYIQFHMHRSLRIAKQFTRFSLARSFPIKLRSFIFPSPSRLDFFCFFFNEPTTFASKSFSGLISSDETGWDTFLSRSLFFVFFSSSDDVRTNRTRLNFVITDFFSIILVVWNSKIGKENRINWMIWDYVITFCIEKQGKFPFAVVW